MQHSVVQPWGIQEGSSEEVTPARQPQGGTGWSFNKGRRETAFQMEEDGF